MFAVSGADERHPAGSNGETTREMSCSGNANATNSSTVTERAAADSTAEPRSTKQSPTVGRRRTVNTPDSFKRDFGEASAEPSGLQTESGTRSADCSTTHSVSCSHPLDSLNDETEAFIGPPEESTGPPETADPRVTLVPRGVVLLSQICVCRDELLELLKYVPVDILMAEPQEATSLSAGGFPLSPIDSVCERCPMDLLEEYCRKFMLRISRFYIVLLSTTVAIRVVVATESEGSRDGTKCYTVALCRGIVGCAPYQLDGSWIGTAGAVKDGTSSRHVSIGMTMRLFAESLGSTFVKVPLHGVSNRPIAESDLEEAVNDLLRVTPSDSSSDGTQGQSSVDALTRTLTDLEGRALALQCLRRFAACLETLVRIIPLLRIARHESRLQESEANLSTSSRTGLNNDASFKGSSSASCAGDEDTHASTLAEGRYDGDDDIFSEESEDRTKSVLENPELLPSEVPPMSDRERQLREKVRLLLKEMQTRLFEAAFISKQKTDHDIATVERSLKKIMHSMQPSELEEDKGRNQTSS